MAEAGYDGGRALSGVTSLLKEMSEISYFYLIAISFFLLDNCLVFFFGKNISNFGYGQDHPETTIANAVIFIFLLSFSVSFFFPTVKVLLKYIIDWMYIKVYLEFIDPTKVRIFGYKGESPDNRFLRIVELQAIRERDEFTLKRVDDARTASRERNEMTDMFFTWVCLLAINLWMVGSDDNPSISRQLSIFLCEENDSDIGYIICAAYWVFICLLFIMLLLVFKPEIDVMIYAPRRTDTRPPLT
jgi:hypothetical protein